MRHLKKGKKFGRESDLRRALMKSLATALFLSGKIITTEAKAKALVPYAEKFLSRAKASNLANRRYLASTFAPHVVRRIISRGEGMRERAGGNIRITKAGARMSDSARMAIVDFLK